MPAPPQGFLLRAILGLLSALDAGAGALERFDESLERVRRRDSAAVLRIAVYGD